MPATYRPTHITISVPWHDRGWTGTVCAWLHLDATLEDLNFKAARGLDRSLVLRLASGQWIPSGTPSSTASSTNAHRITLKGGSMRRLYDSTKEVHNTPGHA